MKLTLTLTAETEADNARIAQIANDFGDNVAAAPATGEPEAPKKGKGKKAAADKPAEAPAKAAEPELNHKAVRKMFGDMVAALGDEKGSKEGKALLKKYSAKQVPDIAKDDLPKVAADLQKLIASAGDADEGEEEEEDFLGDDSEDDDNE